MIGDYIDKNFTNYIISIIPTSPIKRKINNGYQMDHIEKELRLLGYPIKQLLKKRYGKNQKKLNKEDRNKNLENRYYLKKNVTDRFENIILIDDVFTTGATINTVSKLLEVFGSIYSITLYRDWHYYSFKLLLRKLYYLVSKESFLSDSFFMGGGFLMSDTIDQTLKEAAKKVVEKSGFSLVDFNIQRLSGKKLKAGVIVYGKNGISLDDCAAIHKVLFPRLEMLAEDFDFYLEIASPGITRTFKNPEEYSIFIGNKVKVLTFDDSEYIHGELTQCEDGIIILKNKDDVYEIKIDDIQKGKLDY